ncbi:hypothetical protein [Bradyrhizobium sp. 930_D9_N1_4]|uniref:hypothetical protein n=1 Tax=Bradyrhizobium sp. 930_D9_N1_4 TaxID=3240374 RepID=UPI003F8C3534
MLKDQEDSENRFEVLIQLVWDLHSPDKFNEVYEELGRLLDTKGLQELLELLRANNFKHRSGITMDDVLDAINVRTGVAKCPGNLRGEMLLMGASAYGKMAEYTTAEEKQDRDGAIAIGKALLLEIRPEPTPRLWGMFNAGVGTKLHTRAATRSAHPADEAVPFLETALNKGTMEDAGQAICHMHLMQIYSKPSWDDPEGRQQKATEHAARALALARKTKNFEIIFHALVCLIDDARDKGKRFAIEDKLALARQEAVKARELCRMLLDYVAQIRPTVVEFEEDYDAALATLDRAIESIDERLGPA